MVLPITQTTACSGRCRTCMRVTRSDEECDGHSPCPGYGTRASCPPLIVLAIHEWMAVTPSLEMGRRSA